jgi:hypothetical protein
VRVPLPSFPEWRLELSRSVIPGCLVLSLARGTGGRPYKVVWDFGVGWFAASRPGLSSWGLAGPLRDEAGWLPAGLEDEVVLAAGRDVLLAFDVMES